MRPAGREASPLDGMVTDTFNTENAFTKPLNAGTKRPWCTFGQAGQLVGTLPDPGAVVELWPTRAAVGLTLLRRAVELLERHQEPTGCTLRDQVNELGRDLLRLTELLPAQGTSEETDGIFAPTIRAAVGLRCIKGLGSISRCLVDRVDRTNQGDPSRKADWWHLTWL